MGIFDRSESTKNQFTTVRTTTTTNIRDIGLTGNAAVDMAKVLQQGSVMREAIAANTLQVLSKESGNRYDKLLGGANTAFLTAKDALNTAKSVALGKEVLSNEASMFKFAAIAGAILLSILAVFGFVKFRG